MKRTVLLLYLISLFPIVGLCNEAEKTSLSNEKANTEVITFSVDDDEPTSIVFKEGVAYDFGFDWKDNNKNRRKLKPHWSGVGFSFINFENPGTAKTPSLDFSSSYSFNWNLASASVTVGKHWLLVSGLGIDWSRYHFKGNYGLEEVDGITQFVPAKEGDSYRDSKLLAYFFTVPLLLEYQTSRKGFYVNAGPVVYINCYSKSQIELRHTRGDGVDKIQLGKGMNILPVNLRLMTKIGMGKLGLAGYYSPFSLFGKNQGPELYPWGAGVFLDF